MPENIYSQRKNDLLLLTINRFRDINKDRTDVCPENEFVQISTKKITKGTKFKPHRHNELERVTDITQEAWVVLRGRIKATFWDIDDTIVKETELTTGDCAVVYRAGHGFEVLEDDTILYEIKTGPYFGMEKDKTMIETNKGV